ncbi:MAG: His/Gly/Thr/Pro-type tRNA ligase C-terminal domain-containing protein, partial [Rhizobium oryzihabitans]
GKTTTIAKLAARAALGRRQRVALVSVDTFRVGGEEQIRIFADLIGVPLQIIVGPRSVANGEVEVKDRKTGERETVTIEAAMNRVLG